MKRVLILLLLVGLLPLFGADSEFSSPVIHVGVVVSDLDASLEFYTEVIGMEKTGEFDINKDFGKRSGLSNGVPFHVEVLKLQDGEEATQWKLMSFESSKSPKSDFIQDQTGMQYITINVNSLTPFLQRIKQHHVKLLGDTPTPLANGKSFVLIQDPDGTFIELIGPLGQK